MTDRTSTGFLDYETGVQRPPTRRRRPAKPTPEQDDLFAAPALATPTRTIRTMVRPCDPIESQVAAAGQVEALTEKQEFVLYLLALHGPMTDHELEHCPEALVTANGERKYRETTLSKRRTELFQMGKVEKISRRDGKAVWALVSARGRHEA